VKARITCFTITRNVLSQGYPFLEVVVQALPVCDELLVGDGGSTDGTLELLRKLEELNPKIKVYVDPWPGRGFAYDLRWATNRMLERCKGDYILYIQANEVIHERSWEYLRHIHEIYPGRWTFSLPFWFLIRDLLIGDGYRLRMARNMGILDAKSDAYTLGLKNSFMVKEFMKSLLNPKYFARIVYWGLHAMYAYYRRGYSKYTIPVVLPKPIFRYAVVYPLDMVRKMKGRLAFWGEKEFRDYKDTLRELEELENMETEAVSRKLLEILRKDIWEHGIPLSHLEPILRVPIEEHPKIMRELLQDNEHKHYYIREDLFRLVREYR